MESDLYTMTVPDSQCPFHSFVGKGVMTILGYFLLYRGNEEWSWIGTDQPWGREYSLESLINNTILFPLYPQLFEPDETLGPAVM